MAAKPDSSLTLEQVLRVTQALWPLEGAEDWDAPGLVTGNHRQPVRHIRLVVDAIPATVDEAIEDGCDLIIAHHPLLFSPVHSVAEDRYKGHVVASLIRGNVALLAAHTNADVVPTGTSRVLANALGITEGETISSSATPGHGIGFVGSLPKPMSLYGLASALGNFLPSTAGGVRLSGDPHQSVHRVALCAGAGDSLLGHPAVTSSDVYITSDLRHHPASEVAAQRAIGRAPALIDISHFAAEWLWLEQARTELTAHLPDITVTVSDLVTDPWDVVILPGTR